MSLICALHASRSGRAPLGHNRRISRQNADETVKESAMDESRFWKLVDGARAQAGVNEGARPSMLRTALADLPAIEIQAFQRLYDGAIARANHWDLFGAACLMNGGCSDDGFRYFRDWLISEGRETYERALADPDSLADFAPRDVFELESFGYAAMEAYAEHSDRELERDFSDELAVPEGREWDTDELPRLFPRLAARYGH
jgi:hypothetical protein